MERVKYSDLPSALNVPPNSSAGVETVPSPTISGASVARGSSRALLTRASNVQAEMQTDRVVISVILAFRFLEPLPCPHRKYFLFRSSGFASPSQIGRASCRERV